jgi:hypothetical protein
MKKQNLYIIVTVLLAATLMVGCEKNDTAASGTPEPVVTTASVSDPATVAPVVIDNPDVTVPDNGNDDDNQQIVPEEDPYEVLLMTPEYAIDKTYEIALLYRDGSYYSLGDFSETSRLYRRRDGYTVYTVGEELPILSLEEGDVVYGYTDDGSVPKLSLRKASKMPGYTIPLSIDNDGDTLVIDEDGQYIMLWKLDISILEITDEDGNNLSIEVNEDENNLPSLHNLEKGKVYTFGYYEGIYFQGYNLISNSVEYEIGKDEVEVPGEITKEGYIYDFSGIEPGMYYTNYGGFITVE